jgi:hypothetical protein
MITWGRWRGWLLTWHVISLRLGIEIGEITCAWISLIVPRRRRIRLSIRRFYHTMMKVWRHSRKILRLRRHLRIAHWRRRIKLSSIIIGGTDHSIVIRMLLLSLLMIRWLIWMRIIIDFWTFDFLFIIFYTGSIATLFLIWHFKIFLFFLKFFISISLFILALILLITVSLNIYMIGLIWNIIYIKFLSFFSLWIWRCKTYLVTHIFFIYTCIIK